MPHPSMPLLQREATYKDKATARPLVQNTPRTRMVIFLVTVALLIVYSLNTFHQDGSKRLGATSGDIRVSSSLRDPGTLPIGRYHDSDVDFSKHGIDYSKLGVKSGDRRKSTSNDGVDESNIDRSLDSKVVGSINMGDSVEDDNDKAIGVTLTGKDKPKVHADVTRASNAKQNDEEVEEKALVGAKDTDLLTKPVPVLHQDQGHLKDHAHTDQQKLSAEQRLEAQKSGKVIVEQFENGGVRVLDRINMAS